MNSYTFLFKTVSLKDFETTFGDLVSNKSNFFGYFYGGYDENGNSWCSDCVTSKPIIEEASKVLEGQSKVQFYKFPVDEVKEWKRPDFIFRVHPKIKLTKVPTLIYYNNGVEFGRLTEGELFDKANVEEFIKQSLE